MQQPLLSGPLKVKKLLFLSLFCLQSIYADQPLEEYFSYISQIDRSTGNYREGEIEIVLDPLEIAKIQHLQENRLLQKGFSPDQAAEFSRVGIINEDPYWIWIRDAVYFPNQIPGTYDRLFSRNELIAKRPGVAVLPVLPSGKVVLILTYRHATRSWELELPRGGLLSNETAEEAAFRELKEETGLVSSSLHFLGEMAPDTGVLSSIIPVFMGLISAQEESAPEDSEVIAAALSFTKDELKEGVINGFLEVTLHGTKKQIPLRDPFLTFALLQAEYRKYL
jgi:ADP-ribose pyrophosphatase